SIRGASNMSDDVLLASYYTKSRRVSNLTPSRFEYAASIFCRYHEDPLEHPPSSSGSEQEIANMIQDVEVGADTRQNIGAALSCLSRLGPICRLSRFHVKSLSIPPHVNSKYVARKYQQRAWLKQLNYQP
ncbi:hypothetical protein BGX28_000328, partial [Mortierella sp. GBA30]